jgi:LysM repeat protein
MLKRLLAVSTATFIALAGIAFAAELRQDHPSTYTVRKGDTLWDISAKFLRKPWLWPEIWQANPQVKNPHRIYPGDVLSLVYAGGRPQLGTGPQMRQGDPVGAVPLSQIEAFLKELTVVSDVKSLPYVIGLEEDRLRSSAGQLVYVKGLSGAQPGQMVQIARPIQDYVRGANYSYGNDLDFRGDRSGNPRPNYWASGASRNSCKKCANIGVELMKQAMGEVTKIQGDVATVVIRSEGREVREGDRILPANVAPYDNSYFPTAATNIPDYAQVLSIADGLGFSGTRNVIALSVGSADGVKNGTTFSVWRDGSVVPDSVKYKDPFRAKKYMTTLPDEFEGNAMVFRTFDNVSYALLMDGIRPVRPGDLLKSPDATE